MLYYLVETFVVLCSLSPAAFGLQVFVSLDTTFRRLTECGAKVIAKGFFCLFLTFESCESNGLIDIIAGPLFVHIVTIHIVTLFVLGNNLTIALVPPQSLVEMAGLVKGINNVDEACEGVLIRLVVMFVLYLVIMPFISGIETVVDGVARHTKA